MRLSNLIPARTTLVSLVLSCFVGSASAYFKITQPASNSTWVNGAVNPVSWTKGLLDGISSFDVELARLSQDGLIMVAKDVPTSGNSFNILLQDVPAADDYFLLFLNVTHGAMYSISPKFTIVSSSSSASSTPSPTSGATVTVSGGPDPTKLFATTFPATSGSIRVIGGWSRKATGAAAILGGCLLGGILTLW
ncbi:hypothetical protein PLICRDRAFT_178208 [Plicaturopsis crispa FD-325 SS-3]|nr:hypothetical protein PLICRDRAFT_178208 [Plicaturopsis crispa FD-325 SS-3]